MIGARFLLRSGLCIAMFLSWYAKDALADVRLPTVLSDHMVLQRDKPVPIWGTAEPNEVVTVTFRTQKHAATAGADGAWRVQLEPLTAGGPDELTVGGENETVIRDVLVGEVWVGSGQSNMQGHVKSYTAQDAVLAQLAATPHPRIRLSYGGGAWKEATPENIAGFSALMFAFGVNLEKELDVPIGLMVGAVGNTASVYWLAEDAYQSDAALKKAVDDLKAKHDPVQAQAQHEADLKAWETRAAAYRAKGRNPPAPPVLNVPGEPRGKVGGLFKRNIRPMVPFAIRGVVWDQGESGTGVQNIDQCTMTGALIRGWRREWGQGEFPFIYLQKPSGGGCAWDPQDPVTQRAEPFAALPKSPPSDDYFRLHHLAIRQFPATYLATASDLGSSIHPLNKSGYGARAARVALGAVYGRPLEISGPTYKSHVVEGDKLRVHFDHVGQGLAFRHGDRLQGFAIAGADRKFVWADAAIDGDSVVLAHPTIAAPQYASYAASAKHPWANLFNRDGLPALSFSTAAEATDRPAN